MRRTGLVPVLIAVLAAATSAQRELLDDLNPDTETWDNRLVGFGPELEPVEAWIRAERRKPRLK